MKLKSKQLIKLLKIVLNIAWVLNIILATIGITALTYEFGWNNYADWNTTVHIPQHAIEGNIQVTSNQVKDVVLRTNMATLGLKIKNTAFVKISSFFLLFAIEFLIFAIIYHLRKLFSSLDKNHIFTYENVKSLRKAALFIAVIFPVQLILYLFELEVVHSNFSTANKFSIEPTLNFEVLIIAAILYIVAEIFNAGLELKQENEEFV